MKITYDSLPGAVSKIIYKLELLERLILNYSQPESDVWFDINELCKYHPSKPAKVTVYTWVRERRIPFHKNGKKLTFLKSEIDSWLKQGRQKTVSEIEIESDNDLASFKRKERKVG